jgi:hypothetical protein
MLTAKLFAVLASILFIFALLGRVQILPSTHLYFPVKDRVFGPYYWQFFGAIACALFAFVYFAVGRWMPRLLNPSIGLVSFILIAVAFLVWLTAGFFMKSAARVDSWLLVTLLGAKFSFFLGSALVALVAGWVSFCLLRARIFYR